MIGKRFEADLRRSCLLPITALCLAIFLGPMPAAAQTTSESRREALERRAHEAKQRKREAAEKRERAQAPQREATERRQREAEERRQKAAEQEQRTRTRDAAQPALDRERARERQAEERREREQWERRQIEVNQQRMWEADRERSASRPATQSPTPGPYSIPTTRPTPSSSATSRIAASSQRICTANPVCPTANGYGNVCIGVRQAYPGTGSAQTSMQDIVSRCQAANQPDRCNASYRVTFGGGCPQQCASVASCSTTAAR